MQQNPSKQKMPFFHPIPVHFPLALFPSAFVSFVLYVFFGLIELEHASYIMLLLGMLSVPFTIISGITDWRIRYHGQMTRVFKIKIISSVAILSLSFPAVLIRLTHQEISILPLDVTGWIYFSLLGALLIPCTVVGHFGGKLVFH